MKNAELLYKERARLISLKRFDILDLPSRKQYNNIIELAAYICDVREARINLDVNYELWSALPKEIDAEEESFCIYTMNKGDLTVVEDARLEERFKENEETLRKDNPIVFYAGYPLRDAENKIFGTLCVIDDKPKKLTERQKHALLTLGNQVELLFELRMKNNELEKSRSNLQYHNNLLKNFAGAVSHDLKVPLANTIMTVDILKSKYADKLDEKALDYLDRLKQSSFGMNDYISNILEYYETENISSLDYSKDPFSLLEFLEDIIDMLNIETECEINLPAKDFDLICNRSALEQIFLNLLANSIKYNDKKKTIIDIDAEEQDTYYMFRIRDNGMGIPKEKQATVFELFSTAAEKDKTGKKGHGIGLSTVKKIIQKLGGNITLTSEPGEYTLFNFSIRKQVSQ